MYNSFQVMFMSLYGYFSHVVWYFYPVSLVWELVIDTTFGLVNHVRPGTGWANLDSKNICLDGEARRPHALGQQPWCHSCPFSVARPSCPWTPIPPEGTCPAGVIRR